MTATAPTAPAATAAPATPTADPTRQRLSDALERMERGQPITDPTARHALALVAAVLAAMPKLVTQE